MSMFEVVHIHPALLIYCSFNLLSNTKHKCGFKHTYYWFFVCLLLRLVKYAASTVFRGLRSIDVKQI